MTIWLQSEVERVADARQDRALAVFDVLDEWIQGRDFDCRSTIDSLVGARPAASGAGEAPQDAGPTRATLEAYAEQAGYPNPREAANQLQILMMGAIVSAGSGDGQAAKRARSMAELLLDGAPAAS